MKKELEKYTRMTEKIRKKIEEWKKEEKLRKIGS